MWRETISHRQKAKQSANHIKQNRKNMLNVSVHQAGIRWAAEYPMLAPRCKTCCSTPLECWNRTFTTHGETKHQCLPFCSASCVPKRGVWNWASDPQFRRNTTRTLHKHTPVLICPAPEPAQNQSCARTRVYRPRGLSDAVKLSNF